MKLVRRPLLRPASTLLLSTLFALLTFANASWSQTSTRPSQLGTTALEWKAAAHQSAVLTISGPRGVLERRTFTAGTNPSLSLFDTQGQPLAAGLYAWELVTAPDGGGEGPTSSGTFRIANGAFVLPSEFERKRDDGRRDQEVADDLIVRGSTCVGLDCANGETFGTDNLRLKANVLRLRFDDTSTGSGFPATDWQLTANDADTGGANKFSLDDTTAGTTPLTVRGGAPTNSLFVDAMGRVGLGTSTPAAQLHVFGTGAGTSAVKLLVENANPGAAVPRELYELRNKGDVGFIVDDTTDPERWFFGTHNHSFLIDNQALTGLEYTLGPTGNMVIGGTLTQSSDRDAKADILEVDPTSVLSKVAQLPIATWRYKTDPANVQHLGPMAQDFAATFGLGADDKHIAPGDMAGVSLAAIQALVAEVQDLKANNDQLAKELADLRARLEGGQR